VQAGRAHNDLVAGEPRIEIKASRNGAPYMLVLVVDK